MSNGSSSNPAAAAPAAGQGAQLIALAPPPTIQHLSSLLHALTQPDTQTIRQAEVALKPLLKNPQTMMVLWQVLSDSNGHQPVPVRHVAAVILRKRLPAHYSTSYDANLRLEWQQNVFAALASEPVRPVRAGLTGVAAALAAVEQQATPPMLQFLAAAANEEQNPAARELCFLLLQEMTETVGMHWKEQHLPALLQLFTSTLNNPNEQAAVHKAAVQAVGQLMSFWADEPEIEGLAPLLPVLLQVAHKHSSSDHDEDFLATVLDVLYDLAYSPAPCLTQYLPVTTEFALHCLQNTNLELRVRDAAALVIATTAEAKPKTFGRNTELLGRVLDALFQLMQDSPASAAGALFESNPAWRQDLLDDPSHAADDFLDQDNPTETSMAQGTLDMICCEVPNKYVWPAVHARCLQRMQSADSAAARKAGVAGLGVVAEGCAEPLTAALPQVLPAVFAAAQDPHDAQVRECACFCLGQVSEHCQPDILNYATQILPIVFRLLDDNNVAVQATSCYVLEMFCERLEPVAVRPLLDQLVRKLATMLEATTKRSVQEMAVAALAATAVAAEEEFAPYVQGVASLMLKLMALQDHHLFALRGRALECMGHMAIAVGRDTFRPYFADTMRCAMEGLTVSGTGAGNDESTDLQEFAYAVFANLSKVMKEEFAPALPDLVPHLIQVIDMDEGQLQPAAQENGGNDAGAAALATLDDSDNEGEDGDGNNYVLHVRTALFEVKKGAITALGEMAAHTGTSFCPHLEASMQVLQKAATNWHPLIKSEVADAFPSMILPSVQAYHEGTVVWKKGDTPDAATSALSQHTSTIVQAVLTEELILMKDEDKTTVGKACEAVQSVIEICGPHALAPVVQDALSVTHDLLIKQAPCQQADELYGEIPEGAFGMDDDDDHDVFMQAACDLVGAFGRVMGDHLAPYLPQFLPAIMQFAKPSRPASDRSMAVGCLSEIAQELSGPTWQEHWKTVFLPAILQGLQDEDENVNRNAAFLAGIACEQLGEVAGPDYAAILQPLGPILAKAPQAQLAIQQQQQQLPSESALACMDNSAAAVARMIMASPNHVPSMEQVVPVFIRGLPLMVDMTENETVYKCLLGLVNMKHPALEADQVQRVLQQATAPESKVDDEWKGRLAQTLQSLSSQ